MSSSPFRYDPITNACYLGNVRLSSRDARAIYEGGLAQMMRDYGYSAAAIAAAAKVVIGDVPHAYANLYKRTFAGYSSAKVAATAAAAAAAAAGAAGHVFGAAEAGAGSGATAPSVGGDGTAGTAGGSSSSGAPGSGAPASSAPGSSGGVLGAVTDFGVGFLGSLAASSVFQHLFGAAGPAVATAPAAGGGMSLAARVAAAKGVRGLAPVTPPASLGFWGNATARVGKFLGAGKSVLGAAGGGIKTVAGAVFNNGRAVVGGAARAFGSLTLPGKVVSVALLAGGLLWQLGTGSSTPASAPATTVSTQRGTGASTSVTAPVAPTPASSPETTRVAAPRTGGPSESLNLEANTAGTAQAGS